jgi:hypothetical protein
MQKTLLSLVFGLFLFAVPVFAQHGHGGHSGGGGHYQSRPTHDGNRNVQHENRQTEQKFHQSQPRGGYHYGTPRGEFAAHWNGHAFDHEFFEAHWGYGHPFYWGHCGWYGPRWAVGSAFWYDGLYFDVIDPIPYAWYDDQVVVVYDPACDCYFAENPIYPGVRIHVGIRF